ncbi:MAG: hypothetical protein NTW00_02045 [Hyphomicrobiales bacterium]|jgi:hypothetical protein|nr:hypothetical protein [Hyphomicrobiales bacterium]
MATKADFTVDEWKLILGSPMLTGMAVTLAEPSGLWGMMQEGMASGQALLAARKDPGALSLVKDIVADMETGDGRAAAREGVKAQLTGKTPAELKAQVLTTLTRVSGILDAKAGADSGPFKAWLKHVSERVAEASTEGGFLGFGGVKVTEAEKASIEDVARALNIPMM